MAWGLCKRTSSGQTTTQGHSAGGERGQCSVRAKREIGQAEKSNNGTEGLSERRGAVLPQRCAFANDDETGRRGEIYPPDEEQPTS